ncbi:hypothetical protein [Formosa algae]|uniref:hypothetical protein n=1 Tax=Formosa algae TaxID=225843 RepID=UPI000CCDF506|nr:hypothetical protein [Formosa algae]PNW28948.1 hypothetical protein BKP44_06825 [Formosa algae]
MKKLAYVLFGILMGVLGSHLMQLNEMNSEKEELKNKMTPEQGVTKGEEIPEKPKGLISESRGIELSDNYTPRYELISKSIQMEDNRSVWFSLDTLEKYVKYAKYETDQILKGKDQMNGIRLYLGAYSKTETLESKANYTTVFLVPTYNTTKSKASVLPSTVVLESSDVPGGSPLNEGDLGEPPGSKYPN